MNGYIKYFNDDGKNMSFVTDDEEVYEKYNEIWEKVKLIASLKILNGINRTTFTNNIIPIERNNYTCIAAIDINSVSKIEKRAYPHAYLEQCKYKLRKRRAVNFIDDEIVDDDSDIDSGIDSHNNFPVPDSYVIM